MSDREALLAGIVANPEDDSARLVFADWCEDNGDPDRAEFIRAQIRLEGMPEWDPERFDLEERSQDLLSAHWDEWTDGLPEGARKVELTFRRGFVGEVKIRPEKFLECGDELVEAAPLLRVNLCGLRARPEELARSQAMQGLREVVVNFGWDRPGELDALDAIAFFREWRPLRLRHLGLWCEGSYVCLRYPIDWPGYQGLVSLSLVGMDATDGEVAALLALPSELRRLEISGYVPGEESVLAACRHDRVSELDLDVSRSGLVEGTPRAAQTFTSNGWKRLDSLTLSGLQTHEDELRAMTAASWFSRLRSLETCGTPFDACAALSVAPAGLRHLSVTRSEGDGLASLLNSELVEGLTSFELHGFDHAPTMLGLARSPRLSGLRRLSASPHGDDWGSLSFDLMFDLVESPHLAQLTQLDLCAGGIGPAEAARLAGLSGLCRLRALKLWGCRLGEAGIRALARSPHLTGLRRLSISAEDGPCLRALLEAPWLSSLRELRLRWVCREGGIEDDDLEALASSPAVSRLRVLHLGPRRISRAGTEALANSPYLGGLLWLNVGNHSADDDLYKPLRERFGGRFVGCF